MISRSTVKNINVKRKTLQARSQSHLDGYSIHLNTLKVVAILLTGAFLLFLVNLIAIYLDRVLALNGAVVKALVYYFDASREQSIPTLFSSLLLFIASILLLAIFFLHSNSSGRTSGWLILSIVFFFLLLDEATSIHEQFNRLRMYIPDDSGYLYYAWIVPYGFMVVILAAIMFRFIKRLPVRIRNMMLLHSLFRYMAAFNFSVLIAPQPTEEKKPSLIR